MTKPNKSEKIRIICSECNKIVEVDKGSQPYIRCSEHLKPELKPNKNKESQVDEIKHLAAITIRDFAKQYSDMEKIKDYEIQQLKAKLKKQEKELLEWKKIWVGRKLA